MSSRQLPATCENTGMTQTPLTEYEAAEARIDAILAGLSEAVEETCDVLDQIVEALVA